MIYGQNYHSAIKYAKKGISVIPIGPNSKKPLVEWKKYSEAPAKTAEVADWFITDSDKNVVLS